jgi:hypothetical protein
VLYRYSGHTCYSTPSASEVTRAERQVPTQVLDPLATVRRYTSLPLTSVIVDRMSRSRSRTPRVWIIDYVFGHAPDLGLPDTTVPRSARFLVLGEAVGRINLRVLGKEVYDEPQFERIRVNSRGRAIWVMSVNLPGRNTSLGLHSTLPRGTLERLTKDLMRQSYCSGMPQPSRRVTGVVTECTHRA